LEDAKNNNVDKFIFTGDYIFDMPFSNEVAELLMGLENAHIIKGNKEGYLQNLANDNQDNWTLDQFGSLHQTFRELSPDVYHFLNNLDDECYINLSSAHLGHSEHTVYAVHFPKKFPERMPDKPSPLREFIGSSSFHKRMLEKPFNHEQYLQDFNNAVNTDEFKNVIADVHADIIIFGHNHQQGYGYCDNRLIINPGSCGLPLDFNTDAAYTILEITDGGLNGLKLNVIEKRVKYDIEYAANQLKKSALYEKGRAWSELMLLSLTTGRDYSRMFFNTAREIALSKNEPAATHFSNATWNEAYEVFINSCVRQTY
jgi:predicted phosphodiesterase